MQWFSIVSGPNMDRNTFLKYQLQYLDAKVSGYTIEFSAPAEQFDEKLYYNTFLREYYFRQEKAIVFGHYKDVCLNRLKSRREKFTSMLSDFTQKRQSMR
jgi:hypothetical protein